MQSDPIVSAEHPRLRLLNSWLTVEKTHNKKSPRYCHLLIRAKRTVTQPELDELFTYIDHAHDGARQSLRAPLENSLHPLHYDTEIDPAFGYPHKLGNIALQAFFGEIIAGIVAEYYAGDGEYEWKVPVYLFRTHVIAFQQLEYMKQTDEWSRQVIGRTGDDGLAFALNKDGDIIAWLACEAKCTRDHSSQLISDNHEKLSQAVTRPIDLLRLIDALKDYRDDKYSRTWISALQKYWWQYASRKLSVRCDLSVYVCGDCPKLRKTWIPTDSPHERYTGMRELTSVEFHCPGVHILISSLYERMDGSK
nr:hypothetical protein [Deltaproteobacteria bacterium]